MDRLLVTGGAGFIGSNFVRKLLDETEATVTVVDKLTYAGSLHNLPPIDDTPRLEFVRADIADRRRMEELFRETRPDGVIHFAAESHVDRSIDGPADFVETNIVGTFSLLDAAREQLVESLVDPERFRFLHVSTDEVYGALGDTGLFTERTPYAPNSPYAASKAAADHLVRAYHVTYGVPTLITNCCNNYGPYQFPEKLIPLMILNALEGRPLPIYGDGKHVRDWLYVEDHCDALMAVLLEGRPGDVYNVGARCERTNIEVVDGICRTLESILPPAQNEALKSDQVAAYGDLKTHVADRRGHDRRYAIDPSKLEAELGWRPRHDFDAGLEATVRWYLDHGDWCEAVQREARYGRERLGHTG